VDECKPLPAAGEGERAIVSGIGGGGGGRNPVSLPSLLRGVAAQVEIESTV